MFMKKEFKQIVSITHQGIAITFARLDEESSKDIYYNILDLKVDSISDNEDWTGFKKLKLPEELRPVGMSLIDINTKVTPVEAIADNPFKVISDQSNICLFQQSTRGTLLLNRFILKKQAPENGIESSDLVLEPVWEVRFERSGKQDIPSGSKDSQTYQDASSEPFIEPTFELTMVNQMVDGRFDVLLLPDSETNSYRWQVFSYNKSTKKIDLFSFPMDSNGLFNLTNKQLNGNLQISPDNSFNFKSATTGRSEILKFKYSPSAVLFFKQERTLLKTGESQLLERNAKVMLAVAVESKGENIANLATIEFSVAKNGTLSEVKSGTELINIEKANYTLEFYENSYVKLPNNKDALSIDGSFKLSAWIYPKNNTGNELLILGGDQSLAMKDQAPYLKLVQGAKIRAGFGNGQEESWCESDDAVIVSEKWSQVTVAYTKVDDKDDEYKYELYINGEFVPVTPNSKKGGVPSGAPISQISTSTKGFTGNIDLVEIYSGAGKSENLVGKWKFDTVDYNSTPPTTPDDTENNNGLLFGPKLVPSNSPVDINSTGTLQIDANGLSTYTGLLKFIKPKSAPLLMYGSDGYVHLYFQAQDNLFSVAIYDVEAARATFTVGWQAKTSTTSSQNGYLQLVARKSGNYMNDTVIKVSKGNAVGLVDLTVNDNKGRKETWTGIPERLEQFIAVVNGNFTFDPSDPLINTGKSVFFDVYGRYPSCRIPVTSNTTDIAMVFVSRLVSELPLQSVMLSGKTATDITATVNFKPKKWNTETEAVSITQTWPQVPILAKTFIETLNGVNPRYDYTSTNSVNTRVYAITAITAPSNEQNSSVQFIIKPKTQDLSITVTDSMNNLADLCNVSLSMKKEDGTALAALWKNVPRNQLILTQILNGSASETVYNYADNASGNYEEISQLILVIIDGLTADVVNHTPSAADVSNMLAITSVFQLYNDGVPFSNEVVEEQNKIDATILQSAYYDDVNHNQGNKCYLNNGSTLIGGVTGSSATNGASALVQPTTGYTNNSANLALYGVNGGWINESPRFGLGFHGKSYVNFDTSNQNIDKLAIAGDKSTELWVKPALTQDNNQFQRLLTFNKMGNPYYPDESLTYALGLERSFCLEFPLASGSGVPAGITSYFYPEYRRTPDYNLDELTIQCWINLPSYGTGSLFKIHKLTTFSEDMAEDTFLGIKVEDEYPKLIYGFNKDSIKGSEKLKLNVWQCISATVRPNDKDAKKVDITLYVDGILQNSSTVTPADKIRYLYFSMGYTDLVMKANGASLWTKGLTAKEIAIASNQNILEHLEDNLRLYHPFTEGEGATVRNRAPNSPIRTPEDRPFASNWKKQGAYFTPYTANKDYAFIAEDTIIPSAWHHLSTVYRSGYSLQFDGKATVNCGNNQSLNANDSFSVDCWITTSTIDTNQTILCKEGSYELRTTVDNHIEFRVNTSKRIVTIKSYEQIKTNSPVHIAGTFLTGPVESKESQEPVTPKYQYLSKLFINGKESASDTRTYDEDVTIINTEADLLFAVNGTRGNRFIGALSDVRLWNQIITNNEIQTIFTTHKVSNSDGIVSYWRFNEQQGKIAYDENGINNAKISSNELWGLYAANSVLTLYVNGTPVTNFKTIDFASYGGYGDEQFQLASLRKDNQEHHGLCGEMDEIRIWDVELTQEQITDNINRTLSGKEEGLSGYWKIDTGSGGKVEDFSGNQNVGELLPDASKPVWQNSDAPLSEEAKEVYNVLGGVKTIYEQHISETPAVTEYADTQRDAYGNIFSVLKRAYTSINNGKTQIVSGYKVGDLDTIYLGQIQTKPSLIGFIEGAPPIPSENQTMPFWAGDISELFIYTEGTYTQLNQASETVRSYTAGNTNSSGTSVEGQAGIFKSIEGGVSFGLGSEVKTSTYTFEGKAGYKENNQFSDGTSEDLGFGQHTGVTLSNQLTPGGEWEPKPYLNQEVGRRFITDNQGYALVKSATADLYMVALKGRGSLVKYTVVPNTDIPEDVNIIDFPINPKYVKNGTLDGKVGLKNDPDYPEADLIRGSYFKPLEAYTIKKEIEREESQLEGYFKQFNAGQYTNESDKLEKFKTETRKSQSYDWEKKLSKRNLVNTYVWTAGGGLHSESTTTMDTHTESYGAFDSSSVSNGSHIELAGAFGIGIYGERDALWDTSFEGTSTKAREESDSFNLDAAVHTDWFLKKPILTGDEDEGYELNGYESNNAPGKVDGYRFNSFFLKPSQRNFDEFTDNVVDQNWLQNSMTANAVALREATVSANGAWRVLFRTTFVSRVPPAFQPVNDESLSPDIAPPANLNSNTWFTKIIEAQIPEASRANPSTVEIGEAIELTLGMNDSNPGILATILPWWKDFLEKAQDIQNKAYSTLYELRVDTFSYMTQKYDSQRYNALSAAQNEEEAEKVLKKMTQKNINKIIDLTADDGSDVVCNDISINQTVNYEHGEQGRRMFFALKCENMPKGSYVRLFSDCPGSQPLINLERTEVIDGDIFVVDVESNVPAHFNGMLTYEITTDETLLPESQIQLTGVYIASPASPEYHEGLCCMEYFSGDLPYGVNSDDRVILSLIDKIEPFTMSVN